MRGQVLKGHLDLLILAVVAAGPAHGYAVIEGLRERSGGAFDLPEGTVYPALHRLQKSGLLRSEWSTVSGRRRRTYHLTRKGVRTLGEERRNWEGFSTAVAQVLGGTPWPATT
ncbi:MAG: PadR family transcriptional regulator [Acidimicrobiales bacterium]